MEDGRNVRVVSSRERVTVSFRTALPFESEPLVSVRTAVATLQARRCPVYHPYGLSFMPGRLYTSGQPERAPV